MVGQSNAAKLSPTYTLAIIAPNATESASSS